MGEGTYDNSYQITLGGHMPSSYNLRLAPAVEMCNDGEISLGKAAEIAEMGIVEFKEVLASLGHKRTITVTARDVRKAEDLMKKR